MQRRSTRARRRWRPRSPPPRSARSVRSGAAGSMKRAGAAARGVRAWISSQHKDPSVGSDLRLARRRRAFHMLHQNTLYATYVSWLSRNRSPRPLNELCSALPSLPMRLQQVGRFVAANDYDATTRSMRELAAVAGADPAAFTRLAKALGYAGWDGLRAALTEARRPEQSPAILGPHQGAAARSQRRHIAGRGQTGGRSGRPCPHLGELGRRRGQGAAWRAADLDCGFSKLPQRGRTAQLSTSPVPARRGATGRRLGPGGSRSRRLPFARCRRRHRLCALFHGKRAVGASGASIPAPR